MLTRKSGYLCAYRYPFTVTSEPFRYDLHFLRTDPVGQIASVPFMPSHSESVIRHPYEALYKSHVQYLHLLPPLPLRLLFFHYRSTQRLLQSYCPAPFRIFLKGLYMNMVMTTEHNPFAMVKGRLKISRQSQRSSTDGRIS